MSGHSKWATIHRQKEATDQKRGQAFTKVANAITVAVREGGGVTDPEHNFRLRLAIEKGRSLNMPKENIERAIKRGTGELEGVVIENITYEAFGPGGVAFVINVLTDNKNRAVAEIKHILSKYGGGLGGPNSVLWMFDRRGVIRVENIAGKREEMELKAIELGAEDIAEEDEALVIYTQPNDLQKVKEGLETTGINIEYAEVELVPQNKVKVEDPKIQEKIEKLSEELDDNPDIDDYYNNLT